MNKVILTTDSGICAKKKENTIVIPAQIVASNGFVYSDGEISNAEMLKNASEGVIYKTSCPLLGDFENTFRRELENGNDVVHLSMSSGISEGSVNGANLVANDLNEEYENKVYVVDSLTGATGGTLLYECAYNKIMNSNLSADKVASLLNELKTRVQASFYVPNAAGYIRSGRDKTSAAKENLLLMATKVAKSALFKFRVDFNEEGHLHFNKVFRSSDIKGMEKMVTEIVNKDNIEEFDPSYVAVGNLCKDKVDMEKIKDYLASFCYFEHIVEQEIGSVVAAYGCNDLCGIALIKKHR